MIWRPYHDLGGDRSLGAAYTSTSVAVPDRHRARVGLCLDRVACRSGRRARPWPRGLAEGSRLIQLHIATISLCLVLTPVLLLGRRGVRWHRVLGYGWVASMSATALLTFGIRDSNHGGLSAIHVLSAITLTQAPMLAWHARKHRVDAHRYTVLSLVSGALLIAGLFTLLPGRMLGRWLFA